MEDNEVVITYKRKRFSSQSNLAHATKALKSSLKSPTKISPRRSSPKVELDAYEQKLNKDCLQCFKCGNFDVDENLLRCGCCSETHHFHCTDAPQKSASWRKWQCPICHRRNNSEDSQHDDVGETKGGKRSKITEESGLGPMELGSHKVLLGTKLTGGCSRKANCSAADSPLEKAEDSIQMDCTDDKSVPSSIPMDCADDQSGPSSKFTDLDDIKPSPICLTSSSKIKYSSGHPEDSMMKLNSDTDERPKEKCRTPLITFSRRVKKKQEGTGKLAEWNSKSEEKQCSYTTLRSYAAESNCIHEGSSSVCSFKDQSASAVVLLEETEMSNIEKDAALKSTAVGGFGETKISGDGREELLSHSLKEANINNQNPVSSRPATDVPYSEDQSKSLMEAAATDFMKNSILIQDDEQSDSAKFGSPVKQESVNELPIVNSEETNLPYEELVEGEHPCELVAPHTSSCMNNIESSKPLTDVVAENLLESQSSSTPSCPAVADEETDGRSKELEWLEDLDRVLRGKKKNRATCSFVGQAGINCGQESSGKASPVVPTKSSLQSTCDQGVSSEHMNGMTPFQGNVFLTKFGDLGFEKQQHVETSTISSLCTDFLGMSPPLNHGGHVDSIKDVQSMLLPSSSGVKDNVHVPNRHLPWNPSNENSFLLRHKQLADNVMTGTRMLNERQCSAMNLFRRYTSKWTEEELDFLWIGVRRHGISNWNAMLRDPKLHFSESRIAEDLAMQWDVEQKKLLNGTLLQPPRFHRADSSSSLITDNASLVRSTSANQYGGSAWSHACSEFPMLTSETKLSLGDVYHQKRNMFHSSGVGIANSLRSESSSTNFLLNSSSVGPVFAKSGIRHQMPISCENTRYDWGPSTLQQTGEKSIHEHQSAGPSAATSNLPHWLQEAVNSTRPRPRGSSQLPVVSNAAHSEALLNDDLRLKMPLSYNAEPPAPPKDPRGRGILKRKSVGSGNKIFGSRINEVSSSLDESQKVGVLPLLGMASEKATTTDVTITREKKSLSNQNRDSDLVVLDSDASSEETISDDQNIS